MIDLIRANIKRLLFNKVNLIFILILPVILIGAATSMSNPKTTIGLVDYDKSYMSQKVIGLLEKSSNIKFIKEEEIPDKLNSQFIDSGIVIEKGFYEDILNGKDAYVKTYSIKETNISVPAILALKSYLNSVKNIAINTNKDEAIFKKAISDYENGTFKSVQKDIRNSQRDYNKAGASMGFLVMNMLLLSSLAPMIMIKDKQSGVLYRIISAPVTLKEYMGANIISFLLIGILQILLVFSFIMFGLKYDLGPNPLLMIFVSIIFSLVCVSMGVAINSISKDLRQSGVISSLLVTPMCMLGGCWWPMDIMPKVLKNIALFIPPTWIMKAYDKLIKGSSLINISFEIFIMLGFAIVFFLMSTWKKVEIAK